MNIVERVKKICLTPDAEWPVIAGESTPTGALITGYVLPLAAISAVAGLVGGSIIGRSAPFLGVTYRTPLATGLSLAVFTVCMAVAGVFLISIVINALAPTFGAQQNNEQALKVAVYSFTPAWVAGAFQVLPALGVLALLGGLYGLYLLYLGLPKLMKCPPEKAVGYTVVVVICAIVVNVVVGLVGAALIGGGMVGAGALGGLVGGSGGAPTASADLQVDPNSALGKLQQLGQGLEESARKAEAAAGRGDGRGQAAAALEGLGAIFGGGTRVDPLDISLLKPFVPDTFAGLPKTSSSAEKTGLGIMISKAEATYSDGAQKEVTLEVLDTGGASGLMGLAGWVGVQGEKESADGFERTQKVGNRIVHEKSSKSSRNEFSIVLGDRFVVNAKGRGVDADALKAAVSGLDLAKLEAMKEVGAEK
jgi:hypothetical protein